MFLDWGAFEIVVRGIHFLVHVTFRKNNI